MYFLNCVPRGFVILSVDAHRDRGAREPFFSTGGQDQKSSFITPNVIRWFSRHPLKSCRLLMQYKGEGTQRCKWIFKHLLRHSTKIICTFWPQLLILGGGGQAASPDPAFPSPPLWRLLCNCVDRSTAVGSRKWNGRVRVKVAPVAAVRRRSVSADRSGAAAHRQRQVAEGHF